MDQRAAVVSVICLVNPQQSQNLQTTLGSVTVHGDTFSKSQLASRGIGIHQARYPLPSQRRRWDLWPFMRRRVQYSKPHRALKT